MKSLCDDSVVSSETFTYDAAGNVTGAPDSAFRYDTNNRLTEYNGNTVSYDLDGNMLSNGTSTFSYDSANRLITADGHTYTYNAENVRIRNLCTDEDTTYTYNTNCKLSKLLCKTTNGVTTKYVYGRGLIGEEVSNTFKTYHFDCRGSTIAITDASGNITDTFTYDTYGKCISHTGTSNVIFGYNGRDGVVTDDNGFIYMRARYYSPEMKRFINADVIAGEISNAVTLNRFAYANGNPVSNIDPFGLSVERGNNSLWYNGLSYEIFTPTYTDDDFNGWTTVHEVFGDSDIIASMDWAGLAVDILMGTDDVNDVASGRNMDAATGSGGKAALLTLGVSSITALINNFSVESTSLSFVFQTKNDQRRVVIKLASSEKSSMLEPYATGRVYSSLSQCSTMGDRAWVSSSVASFYEELTGHKVKWYEHFYKEYDLHITVDKKHKESDDVLYLWQDENGQFMASPIVYENDKVEIYELTGFFFGKCMASVSITGACPVSEYYQQLLNKTMENEGMIIQ